MVRSLADRTFQLSPVPKELERRVAADVEGAGDGPLRRGVHGPHANALLRQDLPRAVQKGL